MELNSKGMAGISPCYPLPLMRFRVSIVNALASDCKPYFPKIFKRSVK